MMGEQAPRRWRGRALLALAAAIFATAFSLALVLSLSVGTTPSKADAHGPFDLPIDPDWITAELQSALNVGQLTNHVLPGAVAARDMDNAQCPMVRSYNYSTGSYVESQADYCKQEYISVWAGKQNAADIDGRDISDLITNMTINPEGLQDLAVPQFVPGMDALIAIDARKYQPVPGVTDPTASQLKPNPYYGRVVNIATLSIDGGVECEPHHSQYSWINGENLVLGCLFSSWSFGVSVTDIPNYHLLTTNTPLAVPIGSIPDAFDAVKYDNANHANDTYIGTWMGGPLYNYGGSPGALVTLNGSGQITGETPAGSFGQIFTDPREAAACQGREAEPVGTCSNPHGIQARTDLGLMETDDYAEPREIVLDPVKPFDVYAFRPTIRLWSISNPNSPTEVSVADAPETWRQPANRAHVNLGIMEGGKTHAAPDGTTCGTGNGTGGTGDGNCLPGQGSNFYNGNFLWSKGFTSSSMCGGGVFWLPDATKAAEIGGDSPPMGQWYQVWDDGFSQLATGDSGGAEAINGNFEDEPGGCAGGAWQQTSPNNRWYFHSVQGRVPLADNYFDQGSQKMVYVLDISHLVSDAEKGIENCNMSAIDPNTGIEEGLEMARITAQIVPQPDGQLMQNPATEVGDCPILLDVLIVHDPTTGGPHWASLDDHTMNADGYPTRMTFDDYFVARTGVDGDHRLYMVNISPTGHLTYDQDFRDETTGSLGVNFNRRDWIPNNGLNGNNGYAWPDGGFYKPHAMVWVCPPGDCADDNPYGAG
jgi:hypothetical protein